MIELLRGVLTTFAVLALVLVGVLLMAGWWFG